MKRFYCLIITFFALAEFAFAADVTITRDSDGSFAVAAGNYTARVGSDGNLHSLNCGGTEFLLDGYRGLVGGGYYSVLIAADAWQAAAFKFTTVTISAQDTITATGDKHKLTYKFLPDAIEMDFSHTADPTIWYLTINPAVKDVLEHNSGETIPFKTSDRNGAIPQLFAANGANVTLPIGSFFYSSKASTKKLDTDPMIHQMWMPLTSGNQAFEKRIEIHAKPFAADAMQATLAVAYANHIFPAGAPAEVGIAGKMRFPGLTVDGEVELEMKDFLTKKEVFHKTQLFKLAALSEKKVSFSVTPPAGFYDGMLTIRQGSEVLASRVFPLAYDIDHMTLPERPADFDRFWDQTLAEQEKVPVNLQMTLYKEEANYKLYKIRFDGLLGRQFYAWLSLPKKAGKFPARLTLPPTGIIPAVMPECGDVVGMSLAIAGQEVEMPAGGYKSSDYFLYGWNYYRTGIEKRETWYYRAVFAACSRAVDILASRPETDPSKIFVTGSSQGGGLTFITAALNPKVAMAVANCPGLFGLEWKLRYLGPNYWPPIDPADPKALEERIAVVRYGDAANFAPRIRCPILLTIGLQDNVTTQVGTLAAWHRLTNASIRALLADPWGGHFSPRGGQWLTDSVWWSQLATGDVNGILEFKSANGLPVIIETKKQN